jgi:predicted porin
MRACGARGVTRIGALVALTLAAAAGVAQAQTAAPAPAPAPAKPEDASLTWKGITLYGTVDIGVQYDTHSAPFSDYFPPSTGALLQKNAYDSPFGVSGNNLSQSRIGLSGNEPLFGDWAGVFRLETFFQPQSGNISDALKSVTLNNGKPVGQQTVGADSSIAGQPFGGAAYFGVASPTVGSFTFGRNVTIVADGISKYDPMGAAQAFSVIGWSGTAAGGGDTEDRRLDSSFKYVAKYGPIHLGAMYQFGNASGSIGTGYQFQFGLELAGLSADAYYFKKYDAISVSSLSVAQVQDLTKNCNSDSNGTSVPPPPASSPVRCYAIDKSVSGSVSDNETYAVMALYNFGAVVPLKLYAGYEHINFQNPTDPLPVGTGIIGGYVLAVVNNAPFNKEKTLQVFWGGLKWNFTPNFDFSAAYYGYKQNNFASTPAAVAACNVAKINNSACDGTLYAVSGVFDYKLSKRFDVYFGSFYNGVQDGLANGYLADAKNNLATTMGARFRF